MNINWNITKTRSGNGIAFGMRTHGAYAMLPCSVAAVTNDATPMRFVDVAFELNKGTPVWSPPT
jgi:hypothetical protein